MAKNDCKLTGFAIKFIQDKKVIFYQLIKENKYEVMFL